MGKNLYTAAQFIQAIPGTGGIISTIAKRVGCEWTTARKYINEMPTVKAAYDDECEAVNDMAESTIINSIRNGDTSDAKWWISRKRKDEFSERKEIDGDLSGDLTIRFTWGDNADD